MITDAGEPTVPAESILTSPPPSTPSTARSADRVLFTGERMALLLALLSPWIAGGIAAVQDRLTYVDLGEGYQTVVEAAILAYVPLIAGRLHMILIRRSEG